MNQTTHQELIDLTRRLLDSVSESDWETYQELCDPSISCFEPEALGHLVEGMEFHRFYFEQGGHMGTHKTSIAAPHVRMLGDDAAVVCYVRLVQSLDKRNNPQTSRFEETRVWHRIDGAWRHVHFHRSGCKG